MANVISKNKLKARMLEIFRELEASGEELIVTDRGKPVLKIAVPAVVKFLKNNASILALVKPQFEVGKGKVGKGGVVRDSEQHRKVIRELSDFFKAADFSCEALLILRFEINDVGEQPFRVDFELVPSESPR